jgi:hypothetical protein
VALQLAPRVFPEASVFSFLRQAIGESHLHAFLEPRIPGSPLEAAWDCVSAMLSSR